WWLARRIWKADCPGNREVGQGRQVLRRQGGLIRRTFGLSFHNYSTKPAGPHYRSPSPYSDQRTFTRASSSGDGRNVGGKRSPPHSGRRGFFHERVASINIRFQRPVPSCATSRSSKGVLGSMGEPKIPGKITTPPSPAFTR